MGTRNLDKIFRPRSVAVIGASDEAGSVGHSVFRNLLDGGYRGEVVPVNIRRDTVQGRKAYQHVGQIGETPDLAIVCTPAATVPTLVRECGEASVGGMIVLSAGFRETGAAGRRLEEELVEASRSHPDLRIVGPNCLGIIVPGLSLNASFAAQMPPNGHVALLSQSGALCTSILDWAVQERIGFSQFVSMGNMLDVTFADLIDYFGEDPQTRSLVLYIESIPDARAFLSAARAFTRTKPIVAYKSGRFPQSAQAAASHTGAMAGEDAVFDAAFRRAGIERVFEIDELFDCAELLARLRPPSGGRLAIITNAGGPGVMAADALIARGGTLPTLSDATRERLDSLLPASWSHGNPIDVLGDAPPERFGETLRVVLDDPAFDAALVVLTPQSMTDPTETARVVADVANRSPRLVLASWMGGVAVQAGVEHLNRAGVPTFDTPERAIWALDHLLSYARRRETLYETPRDIPIQFAPDRRWRERLGGDQPREGRIVLTEAASKELLKSYGIPIVETKQAATADESVTAARAIGYPVVLKIDSEDITHKTDVGGVRLSLRDDNEVRSAHESIVESARQARPDARIAGVTVQPMLAPEHRIELIVGSKHDATFGAVIVVGAGGTAAEVLGDRVLELPPLNERLARRMLETLRLWPLLNGYRGRPAMDVEGIIELLIRFSYLVADAPEIVESDINPLLVTPDRVAALDARAVVDRSIDFTKARPFAHLAIHPYPEEFTRRFDLNGTPVLFRPIRPEDEPLWHHLLGVCSPQSIRARFRGLFREATHSMAARYCFIDYDRELAIVAEIGQGAERRLIGVGRLVADPSHETAEFAILVPDDWQGHGLGTALTDCCLEVARRWGVKRVVAETEWDNDRMRAIFRRSGFLIQSDSPGRTVIASRELYPPRS